MLNKINLHYLDIGIICTYLIVCLIIGLIKFSHVKTLKDYALGTQPFSNTLLFATIFATAIGVNTTLGIAEKSYELGLVFIIPLLVTPLRWMFTSVLLSYNLELFKQKNCMTPGDIMEYWYGKSGRWVTNICAIAFTLAITAASITAISSLFTYFLGLSSIYGTLIAVAIITTYSALGGIRAVAVTDLFQVLIFFVALPVICIISLNEAGGIQNVISSLPQKHLTIGKSDITLFLSFIVYQLSPVTAVPYLQRALIAKDKKQLIKTFTAAGIAVLLFVLLMALVGLIAYKLNPNLDPKSALYYLMGNYLSPGLLGLVLAGLLAVIMSTQDSYLNTISTVIAKDVCCEIWPNLNATNQLRIARVSCIVITGIATAVSFSTNSILGIFWSLSNFWTPFVTVPLIGALLGVKILKKDFIYLVLTCIGVLLIFRAMSGVFDTKSYSVGTITSVIALYIANRRFKALSPSKTTKS